MSRVARGSGRGPAIPSKGPRLVVVALALFSVAAAPSARQVYAPVWMTDVLRREPCLFTVAQPAARAESCIPWTRRETASPAFHAPTGIVILGGHDEQLHGVSGIDGGLLYREPLQGDLVTQPVLEGDSAYFGTTEAHLYRSDVTTGELRWETPVDAEVIEPVVVYDDTVYAITGLETVYAVDRTSGEVRWAQKHPLPGGITLRGQARPLLAEVRVNGEPQLRLYVGHATGRLTVLDAQSGRPIDEITLATGETFIDVDADPLLHEGRLIAASHGSGVFALDPVKLEPLWRFEEKGIVRLGSGGSRRIIAAGAGKVIGLDAETGKERWRFTFPRGAPTRPVTKGGRVHVGSDRGALYVLDLFSGEPLQYFGSGLGFATTPELYADMLFVVSTPGRLFALSNAFAGKVQRR